MKRIIALLLMLLMLGATALAETDYTSLETSELYTIYGDVLAELLRRSQPIERPDATTETEILFRGIPWDATPQQFTDAMAAISISPRYNNTYDMPSFERDFYWTGTLKALYTLEDSGYFCNPSLNNLNVAGFPASYMGAYFRHGFDAENVYEDEDHAQLYLAYYKFNPVDYTTAYDMLAGKLNQLYGEGEVHLSTSGWSGSSGHHTTYTNWTVWQGANDTACCLWYNYDVYDSGAIEEQELFLYYGKSNSVNLLKELEAAMAREQLEQAASDMSGL